MTKMQIACAILIIFCLAFVGLGGLSKAAAVEFREDVIGQGSFQSDTDAGTINKASVQDSDIIYGQVVKFDPGGVQAFYGLNFSGRRGSWTASSTDHYLRAWDCSCLNATADIKQTSQTTINKDNQTEIQLESSSTLFKADGSGKFRERILGGSGKYGRPIGLPNLVQAPYCPAGRDSR